jgi:hypothetical protein
MDSGSSLISELPIKTINITFRTQDLTIFTVKYILMKQSNILVSIFKIYIFKSSLLQNAASERQAPVTQ